QLRCFSLSSSEADDLGKLAVDILFSHAAIVHFLTKFPPILQCDGDCSMQNILRPLPVFPGLELNALPHQIYLGARVDSLLIDLAEADTTVQCSHCQYAVPLIARIGHVQNPRIEGY